MNSPLGKYAQITAVITVLTTIFAWLVATMVGNMQAGEALEPFAILAFGAVLGSAATVNGYRRDQAATNARLDAIGAPPAATVTPTVS